MQTDANRHCAIGIAAGICLGPAMCEWAGAERETGARARARNFVWGKPSSGFLCVLAHSALC